MDVERGIGGEILEALSEASEHLLMTQLLGEEFFESGQDGRSCFGVLAPDLKCEAQEGQIEGPFLLLMNALVGEVACGFRRAGECRGAVVNHIVLALLLDLPLPAFLFPAFIFA